MTGALSIRTPLELFQPPLPLCAIEEDRQSQGAALGWIPAGLLEKVRRARS